ncbi:MAG: alanine--tRNA ligase-related protein, partial [Methanobacteriaceae archaeon]
IIEQKVPVELDYPDTELLFYDTPNQTEFSARILGFYEDQIILNRTLFYPEGGGQPSDIGYLDNGDEKIRVHHALKLDGIVMHKVDHEKLEKLKHRVGSSLRGNINLERRITLGRNHTATHLVVAAARKVLGDHVWQAGAQKGVKKSRIDLSHYQRIKEKEIHEIERMANSWVMKNLPVETQWIDRSEAEKQYGFVLYQGGVVPGNTIRVVKIPGVDVQACAGTHCNHTGEIGLIKIKRTERIQDGVERLEFSAGMSAIEAVQKNDTLLQESASVFKVEAEQLPKTSQRFFTEWKAFKNDIKRLQNQVANLKTKSMVNETEKIGDLSLIRAKVDAEISELVKMVIELTDDGEVDVAVLGSSEGKIVGAASKKALEKGIKINEIIKKAAQILGGGGGGRPNLAQGAGSDGKKIQEALDFVKEPLMDKLAQKKLNGFN